MNATVSTLLSHATRNPKLPFFCVGLNHHHTPVNIREQVAFDQNIFQKAEQEILSLDPIEEALILSTCNRVEIYAHGKNFSTPDILEEFFYKFHKLQNKTLNNYLYKFTGRDALHQLCRVTASLDSQIIGEPQIQGQVKNAYLRARESGTAGPIIHQTFNHALSVAKKIRTQTPIGKFAVSTAYAATQLAEKVLGNIKSSNCLLLGAGQMAEIAAQHMKSRGCHISVANRSLDNAKRLSEKYGGKFYDLEDNNLEQALIKSDIIIASIGASAYLVKQKDLSKILKLRRFKPIFIIDIAVPRNIEPSSANIDGVYLYDIDDLDQIIKQNQGSRDKAAEQAVAIINQELIKFENHFNTRQLAPIIKSIKSEALDCANLELEKTLNSLSQNLSPSDQEKIIHMAYKITKKILHKPIEELKKLV